MTRIAVVADDLSGAVETAATFLLRTTRITVSLDARAASHDDLPDVQVFDTDSRQLTAPAAADRAERALSAVAPDLLVFKKVDSLLRGHLGPELLAARNHRPNIVVATALPAAGRTVVDGTVHLDGTPLHRTDVWHAESAAAPVDIAAALAPLATSVIPLQQIRGADLAHTLRRLLAGGIVPICDAENDDDLDRIVAAVAGIDQLMLVGSAGLAGALARTQSGTDAADREAVTGRGREIFAPSGVLVVVGSAAQGVAAQLEALRSTGAEFVLVVPTDLVDADDGVERLTTRIDNASAAVVVVTIDPQAPVAPRQSRELVRRLSLAVAGAARRTGSLVLTGGETARAVLDVLEITSLAPLFQVHHGAVVSTGENGQLIATRPGSYGDPDSLLSIVRALQAHTPSKESA